ncbi:MAG: homoserine dehydrogenase [Candidatus Melainabacteria bacterium]|nr:homoserine dehydrogenase [Candidatus Melainabacteria bacterium]
MSTSLKKFKIGLLGAGTIGSTVIMALHNHPHIEIKKIGVRDLNKKRNFNVLESIGRLALTTNLNDIVIDPEIEIVVEVLGGLSPAKDLVSKAIQNKKHIVTANKDLIATYGAELFDLAKENNVQIQLEGSVCGGIPIINTLKQTLSANTFLKIMGILNGTTNYILTEMLNKNLSFEQCLKEASLLGYAEPNPTNDVSGKDSAYKLAILASIAFRERIKINEVYTEGIEKITPSDIVLAEELGYRIKLIGIARNETWVSGNKETGKIDIRVHPAFIKKTNTLASVLGVNNGVLVEGNLVGELTLIGQGAGALPTTSSIIGDINLLVAQLSYSSKPNPQFICQHTSYAKIKPIAETTNRYFLRVRTQDKPGVVGQIGTICGKHEVSINALTQRGTNPDGTASITILTHLVKEEKIQNAINEIKKSPSVKQVENIIRVLE